MPKQPRVSAVAQLHEAMAVHLDHCASTGCEGFAELAAMFRRTSPLLCPTPQDHQQEQLLQFQQQQQLFQLQQLQQQQQQLVQEQQLLQHQDAQDRVPGALGGGLLCWSDSPAMTFADSEQVTSSTPTPASSSNTSPLLSRAVSQVPVNSPETVNLDYFVAIASNDSLVEAWTKSRAKPVACRHPGCPETFVNFANRRRHELKLHKADYSKNGKGPSLDAVKNESPKPAAKKSRAPTKPGQDGKGENEATINNIGVDATQTAVHQAVMSLQEPSRKRARTDLTPGAEAPSRLPAHAPVTFSRLVIPRTCSSDFLLESDIDRFAPPTADGHPLSSDNQNVPGSYTGNGVDLQMVDRIPMRGGSSMNVVGFEDPIGFSSLGGVIV